MHPLRRKLFRELWRLRGQVLAVALVIGSGTAVLVMALSTVEALRSTADAYYERYRFGEVFASAVRVPERVADRIAALPGVQTVQTRISRSATLDVPGFPEPVMGRLTSIPEHGQPALNQLVLRSGSWIEAGRPDQVIVNEPFAAAHGLGPGDALSAVINGHERRLQVVGTALSPEFVYSLGPGALLPDDARFGVLWMGREALAAAFDLRNAFNDLSLSLLRGAGPDRVIAAVDTLLAPYGGVSAVGRDEQLSNWFVDNEIAQIRTMTTVLPAIFLSVAAFLSHMVLGRLITTERAEIGLLKAFGYSHLQVAAYYAGFVLAVACVGVLLGSLLGAAFGRYNTQMYAEFFRFPLLIYRPSPVAFLIAGAVSVAATLAGALGAVWRVIDLPPAEAMRPPAPPSFQRGWWSRSRLVNWVDQPTRIALRQIGRWPLRSLLTSAGIALSVGLVVVSLLMNDAVDHLGESYFFDGQHQTLSIGLAEPRELRVQADVEHLPGVLRAEPWRVVPAVFRAGHREHRGGLTATLQDHRLRPIHDDVRGVDVPLPSAGVVLGAFLAGKLRVEVGDRVEIELLEGRRPVREVQVAAVFEPLLAMPAYVHLEVLGEWLGTGPRAEYLDVLADPAQEAALFEALKRLPAVSSVMLRRAAIDAFHETLAENMLLFLVIFTGFACALGFGVAYNSTRIALSERGRELATLRVLGFTRREISYILLGEVALLIVLALPLGCLVGWGLTVLSARAFDTELYRMPSVVEAPTIALAVLISLLSTAVSAALVRRRVERLDLIRVLKTRE